MTIYIALLRGINVGGNNIIKMAELRSALEEIGLARVQTYIVSGNVLFESAEDAALLRRRIEQQILAVFGISLNVIIRSAEELEQIIENCPYDFSALSDGESIQLTLSNESLTQKTNDILAAGAIDKDEFSIHGHEIYFLFRQRMVDSKLGNQMQKLGDSVTSRNWKTILKLADLSKAMQ